MALLYSNENFPLKVAQLLRDMGHDVLSSHEAGNSNQRIPDEAVLAFAVQSNRILLTLNRRDFIALHSQTPNHAGIIVCTQSADLQEQAEQIHLVIQGAGSLTGTLIRVNRKPK